jgi:hypothetical protein
VHISMVTRSGIELRFLSEGTNNYKLLRNIVTFSVTNGFIPFAPRIITFSTLITIIQIDDVVEMSFSFV